MYGEGVPVPRIIDNLPADQRQVIINKLLAGESANSVAKSAGLNRSVVLDYRKKVIRPTLTEALKASKSVKDQEDGGSAREDIQAFGEQTQAVVRCSPVRTYLDNYRQRIDNALNLIEQANECDPNTKVSDIAAMAPILAQAHQNIRILGELTGELGTGSVPQVNMALVTRDGTKVSVTIGGKHQTDSEDLGAGNCIDTTAIRE